MTCFITELLREDMINHYVIVTTSFIFLYFIPLIELIEFWTQYTVNFAVLNMRCQSSLIFSELLQQQIE